MDPETPQQPIEDNEAENDFFEKARQAWKRLGTEVGWTLLFGDLYVKRFPVEVQTSSSATAVKKSIFEADDTVHAFDASGVRKTIRERMIKAEARGVVREWYADLAFFCERMNFLKGIKEEEIDFVVRTSLMSDSSAPKEDIRNDLLEKLDPSTKIITGSLREEIIRWAQPQLELYGFLAAMTTELFPYSEEELEKIVSLLLDPNKVDMFLRARFIDPIVSEEEPRPLIGFEHPDVSTEDNFTVRFFANNDREYFPLRIAQLWFYALLKDFPEAKRFMEDQQSNLLAMLASQGPEKLKMFLWDSILLSRWSSIYTRFLHSVRIEYAFGMDYSSYASDLSFLLQAQGELIKRFTPEAAFPIPFDKTLLQKDTVLLNVGITCIESVMKRLEDQIPVPEGAGAKRAIMAKRRANLRNAVLPENIQAEIMDKIFEIKENELPKEMEEKIRFPGDTLFPRGEAYFKDMKEIVRQQMEAMGDLDLRKELKLSADTPQSLVKQYGNSAINWLKENFPGSEPESDDLLVYAAIISLKSTELMFSSATTTEEQRNTIAKQLFESVYQPQVLSLGEIAQEEPQPREEA
jgi:hypothetical protein